MGSEVCPFCGKTFKRLKSHLPHCKAALTFKKPSPNHDVTENQTSGQPATVPNRAAMIKKKRKEVPPLPETGPESVGALGKPTCLTSSLSSKSSPNTAKKKVKLSDQIKMANASPSMATIHTSLPVLPLSVSAAHSEQEKQNLHGLTKKEMVSDGSSPTAQSTSTDPLKYKSTGSSFTIVSQGKDSVEDGILLSTIHKAKSASKKKVSVSPSKTKGTSTSLNSTVNEHSERAYSRGNFWVDTDEETHPSGNEIAWKSENPRSRITLQDVKATLDRAKSSRLSILSQAETTHVHNHRTSSFQVLSGSQKAVASSETHPSTTAVQQQELTIVNIETKPLPLIPLKEDGSLLSKPASPVGAPLSNQFKSSRNTGLKVAQQHTGLSSIPPPPANLPGPELQPQAVGMKSSREFDGSVMKKLQFHPKRENIGGLGAEGVLAHRRLSQVKLRELPEWLACKTPSHPKDVVDLMQRGWLWYYKKYVDVRKGGVGGVSMLLAGYCVLSYIWSYPSIKHDRWRKYH